MANSKHTPAKPARNERRITAEVSRRIEAERRRLQRASAVLSALIEAGNADAELDYADVAGVVREQIETALSGLDSVTLEGGSRP